MNRGHVPAAQYALPSGNALRSLSDTERLVSIEAKVDAILRLHQQAAIERKPNLRIIKFAELAGRSRWTIMRDIRVGKLRKINGRIPRDQLTKYTS